MLSPDRAGESKNKTPEWQNSGSSDSFSVVGVNSSAEASTIAAYLTSGSPAHRSTKLAGRSSENATKVRNQRFIMEVSHKSSFCQGILPCRVLSRELTCVSEADSLALRVQSLVLEFCAGQ